RWTASSTWGSASSSSPARTMLKASSASCARSACPRTSSARSARARRAWSWCRASMTALLFLYGTLKRGCRNHHLVAGQEFLGPARTLPRYRLYDSGLYPCLVEDTMQGCAIAGELWRVEADALERLDEFEDWGTRLRGAQSPSREGRNRCSRISFAERWK